MSLPAHSIALRQFLQDRAWHTMEEIHLRFAGEIKPEHAARSYRSGYPESRGYAHTLEDKMRLGRARIMSQRISNLVEARLVDVRKDKTGRTTHVRWVAHYCYNCGEQLPRTQALKTPCENCRTVTPAPVVRFVNQD